MLVHLTSLLALSTFVLSAPLQQIPFTTSSSESSISISSIKSSIEPSILSQLETHLESLPEKRLVQLSQDGEPIEITEGEKALLVMKGIKFIDVTDQVDTPVSTLDKDDDPFPSEITYSAKKLEKTLFNHISLDRMKAFLTKFSSFHNRYYRASTGRDSQQFLLAKINEIIKSNEKIKASISVKEFPHSWGQNSIILRFEPSSSSSSLKNKKNKKDEKIVILGAHQDSTNMFPFLSAPGADDDGSGTTTLVEALTLLVNASFVPSVHPVEFHWYSAEEGGLLGSQAVAQSYAQEGKKVRSMLQMDMTAFVKPGTEPVYGIIEDFVSPEFTGFVSLLAKEYGDIKSVSTKCGYACSDHASWNKIGAPSSFVIESSFADSNKKIHSSGDTITQEGFSFEHMRSFVRLSLSMAVEMGGGDSLNFDQ